jgi:hypothetical protein
MYIPTYILSKYISRYQYEKVFKMFVPGVIKAFTSRSYLHANMKKF